MDGVWVKDLRIIGDRQPESTVIVDNSASSFGYQVFNGIPIVSWKDDANDRELYNLIDYLNVLAECEDVRDVNRRTFRLDTLYNDYLNHVILKKNYHKW